MTPAALALDRPASRDAGFDADSGADGAACLETSCAPPAAVALESLDNADTSAKLEAITASGACADGRVLTLDFAAIRTRLQERWAARRESIQTKLEAIIDKHAGRRAIWLRVSDCDYLVCYGEENGPAAQALSFRIMEEALTFFLGQFSQADIQVNIVTRVVGGVVERTAVTPGETACAFPSMTGVRKMIPQLVELASPLLIDDARDSFRLSCALEEVVHLKRDVTVGCRVAPKLFSDRSRRVLTARERAALATQTLLTMDRRVVEMLTPLLAEGSAKMVFAPLSLPTFGMSRARLAIIEQLNRLEKQDRDRLVIELAGFEPGTPSSRLVEAATLLRPFCRYVTAQALPGRSSIAGVGAARLPGMSVSCSEFGADPARLTAGLFAFGGAAQAVSPKLTATDLPGEGFLGVCGLAGFTLATIERADFG